MVVQDSYSPFQFYLKGIQCVTNRISSRFNSAAAHLELYETYVPERFCQSNESEKKSSIS